MVERCAAWHVAVVGPGAMGCLFGGLLAAAGHRVTMLARRPEHAALLAHDGIAVERDGVVRRVAVAAESDPRRVAPADLVVVLVKAIETAAAAALLPPLRTPGSAVLTLQNGLGNVEALAAAVG